MNSLLQNIDNLITFVDNDSSQKCISSINVNSNQFKIISFNILADCYALSNKTYPKYCSKQYLNGDYRFHFITTLLSKQNADIIALQEVDKPELIKFDNKLYKTFFQKKPNKKQDGLLLAFNKHKFCTYSNSIATCIQLNDLSYGTNSENSKVYYRRNCIALYIILTPINNNKHVFIIVNTHLYYHRDSDDIRLRQIAYIMNTIYSKYIQLQNNNNINKISVIFCGDLNTLPNRSPLQYLLNGSYTMKAKGNSNLKLIMDAQLNKLSRWCRSLGIDAACYNQTKLDKKNIELLFQQTKDEDRVLVTKSKKLVNRKMCPNHLLLNNNDIESNIRQVIKYFGIEYNNDDEFYSRCTMCNGELKNLKTKNEIIKNDKIPNGLKGDIYCSFWECLNCKNVIWFGLDKNGKKKKITDTMENIIEIMNEETDDEKNIDDEKNEKLNKILILLPNLQRFFWDDVIINNPFENKLRCSYMGINNGLPPEYTNKVEGFKGCLDYIIYGNIYNNENNDNKNNLKCVSCDLIEGNKELYPNKTWPSDHILLVSTFQFK